MAAELLQLSAELTVGFFALLLITKILGKTQISQLTPFDFISALVLGELVGNAIYDAKIGLVYILFAITLWAMLIACVEQFTQKIKRTRSLLEGRPSIVIREGKLNYDSLKQNKLDLNQLQHLLRDKDVFSLKDVHFAILEANGSISVIKTPEASALTKKDVFTELPPPEFLPIAVILDGEWVEDNLKEIKPSKEELLQDIYQHDIPSIDRILYAEWTGSFPLYLQTY
ncbi:DUF421 domain-containing protein [Alteribacillus sp. HJP-4]|uniref:DUF421 domain-containing protein n=1 Tax=Alteribacillus sp. HJP-4 TaxID=2775394 RepID=UPI0035CCD708